jgi:hypothetical protein
MVKKTAGKRFQAVQVNDHHVRICYKRSRKCWVALKLDFDHH